MTLALLALDHYKCLYQIVLAINDMLVKHSDLCGIRYFNYNNLRFLTKKRI
jgi:hypothetical protein